MKLFCIILLACFLYSCLTPSYAQEKRAGELKAEEILARVDKLLEYPKGRLTGKMIHVTPDGKSRMINVWAAVAGEDWLLKFSSADRGEEVKILYNLNGKNIWLYDLHANKLFNKRGIDKFDSVMMTNFCFIDLAHESFKSSYTAKITGETLIKGNECFQLILEPVLKGGNYGLLELFVSKTDFIPLRIEYHNTEKIIFKTMSVVKTAKKDDRIIPIRYEMLDIKQRTATIFEILDFDDSIKFDKKIFRKDNLWEN